MLNIDAEPMEALPTSEALERILVAYGTLTLSDEVIAMNCLIIRECDQFPEIAAAFYEAAIQRTTDAMAGWLRRQCERGLIKLEDPQAVAGMLRGMMIMEPQRAVMLGQRSAPDHDEIVARAKQCARLFLKGCAGSLPIPDCTPVPSVRALCDAEPPGRVAASPDLSAPFD